jgi:hypothetical protein
VRVVVFTSRQIAQAGDQRESDISYQSLSKLPAGITWYRSLCPLESSTASDRLSATSLKDARI